MHEIELKVVLKSNTEAKGPFKPKSKKSNNKGLIKKSQNLSPTWLMQVNTVLQNPVLVWEKLRLPQASRVDKWISYAPLVGYILGILSVHNFAADYLSSFATYISVSI